MAQPHGGGDCTLAPGPLGRVSLVAPMLIEILHRLQRRPPRRNVAPRTEVCPPALQLRTATLGPGWRAGLREWLSTSWQAASRDPADITAGVASERLAKVRDEFMQALHDIRTQESGMVQERVRIARSLRDLWHLRPEVFRLVALRHSQAEAHQRLDRLNRHFPTRSPRSGFAPLDGGGADRTESRRV